MWPEFVTRPSTDDGASRSGPSFPGKWRLPAVLLVLPLMAYVSVCLFWGWQGIYPLDGDEPQYIVMAKSLVEDGDFALNNQYRQSSYDRPRGGLLNHEGRLHSVHNIGLPILISPLYAAWGPGGVKLGLSILAGLFPLIGYAFLNRILPSRNGALLFSLTWFTAMPYLTASNQIYPDLVGGLIVFAAAERLLACSRRDRVKVFEQLLIPVLIALVPWLHIKFSAAAAILFLVYLGFLTPTETTSPRTGGLITLFLVAGGSALLLLTYNQHAYGSFLGPYSGQALSNSPRTAIMVLLGLHWDQAQGMFIQQPLLLWGLLGSTVFFHRRRKAGLVGLLLYGSLVLPAALHPNIYGGWSFYGRFGWSSVSLWLIPAGYGLRLWLREERTRFTALTLIAAVLFQLYLSHNWREDHWLLMDRTLFHRPLHLRHYLPLFNDPVHYLGRFSNYLVLGLSGLLGLWGWLETGPGLRERAGKLTFSPTKTGQEDIRGGENPGSPSTD